ncbi:hypothetical protein CHS0354_031745 [Potamilus streckersoni]|uniref:Chitin-binding type-2 domain-containing protein n=1 Tax=Potamilus streckersoni TaxID=2493646 RepID=A0AAE0W8M1_9BIVA|nr:hypothetical protein CHS0354_031745 [Potamilus streckersoni]
MKYCIICSVFAVVIALSSTQNICNQGEFKLIPKDDCTGFYLCNWGHTVEMPDCPAGSVFSVSGHSCVPIGSPYDDCKKSKQKMNQSTKQPDTIQELCRAGADIIPHPTECQLYYNCSMWYNEVPRFFEQHLQECPYPLLFSTTTHRCEHFLRVQCGARTVRKSACDYRQNQCGTSHCIPCSLSFPSCEGLPDGLNAHQQKLWTPFFAVCYKERLIHQGRCPSDSKGRPLIFSPEMRQCVPLERVPRQYGGLMPDCVGRVDGLYPDDNDTCHRYFMCRKGKFVFSDQCVVGEVFEPHNGVCIPSEDLCGPCGSKVDC